jgi:hypothetical protein
LEHRSVLLNLRIRSKLTTTGQFRQYACASNSDIRVVVFEQLKELRDVILDHSTQFGLKCTSTI